MAGWPWHMLWAKARYAWHILRITVGLARHRSLIGEGQMGPAQMTCEHWMGLAHVTGQGGPGPSKCAGTVPAALAQHMVQVKAGCARHSWARHMSQDMVSWPM